MLYQNFTSISSKITQQRNIWFILSCVMLLINVTLSITLLTKQEKIILVPPEINKTFWINRESASREYLEEMSLFISSLLLDQTPRSSNFKRDVVLKYVAPEYYNKLYERLTKQAAYLEEQDITMRFSPISMNVDLANNKVILSGEMTSYVADKEVNKSQVEYDLQFQHSGYRLFLKSFEKKGGND